MKKIILIVILLGLYTISNASSIVGQAFLKTQGGNVKTCAGETVYLDNSEEKTIHVGEKDTNKGYVYNIDMLALNYKLFYTYLAIENKAAAQEILAEIEQTSKLLQTMDKSNLIETICDANGNFEFNNITPNKYRIGTTVEWNVGENKQGGFLSKIIYVKDGKNKILLTE